MASVRQTKTGRWELTIKHKLLPKRVYLTFDDEAAAQTYGDQVQRLLAAGIVPTGLVVEAPASPQESLAFVLRAWINSGQPAPTDMHVLGLLVGEVGSVRMDQVTYQWAEGWLANLKRVQNLAPGTIRKRVGSLSRALDWWLRSHPGVMVGNPLKLLPRGAATYTAKDAAEVVALDGVAKVDVERDRRLRPGELARIEAAMAGEKREDRERALQLKHPQALRMLFWLIYHTGMRLREAYTMTVEQVQLGPATLRVRTSKQWHGRVKWRNVPIRRELHAMLTTYLEGMAPDALLFPFWNGDRDEGELGRVTKRLSSQFIRIFDYANCPGLTEHDLRHEATCQWYEMRDKAGQWVFREAEIDRIMGWAPGSKMGARYASFRAEDMSSRLWAA